MIRRQKRTLAILYLIPSVALYMFYTAVPFIRSFGYAFTDWNGYGTEYNYIGFQNFERLFKDANVWNALQHNVFFFLVGAVLVFSISILFAVSLTRFKLQEANFYRIVFYFPNIISIVITSMLWKFIYNPSFGLLNAFLKAVGLDSWTHTWLGETETVLPALLVPWVWGALGFYMVMFIAAIENIPTSLYEAAVIDGASEGQQLTRITLPLIWETIRVTFVFFLLGAFSGTYTIVNVTTKGGPARASDILTTYMYENAFDFRRFGYGTTIGLLLFVILFALALVWLWLSSRETIEY